MLLRARLVVAVVAAAALVSACSSSSGSSSSQSSSSSSSGASAQSSSAPSAQSAGGSAGGVFAGLSPIRVLAKAQTAMSGANSVRFTVSSTGQNAGGYDLRLLRNGNATGTITFQGDTLKVVRIGNVAYLSGHPDYLAPLAPGQDLTGKWVELPVTHQAVASLLGPADLRTGLGGVLLPKGSLAFGPSKTVDGHPTAALVESGSGTGGGTIYVAADGTAYPLLVESPPGGVSRSSARFSEWNQPVSVTAPPAAKVVDLRSVAQ